MEAFRIGEFAQKNGVSVQLLKYYDQHGILRPAWKDETGRYYMDYQSIHLMEYRYLSRTGLSLQEAKALREDGSLADWHTHLSHSRTAIENEIAERQRLLQFIDEMQDYLGEILRKESWRIEPWEGGWFMPKDYSKMYPWWKDGQSTPQTWKRVILGDPPEIDSAKELWGTLLPNSFPQDLTGMDAVQGGLCFVYAHTLRQYNVSDMARLSNPAVDFSEPLKLMSDNCLKPRGDLYQRRICITHEESEVQMQVVTRIPLLRENIG